MTKLGVRVDTTDNGSFEGHIVVGADGIHSTVRQEMWRIGRDIAPRDFPTDELKRECSS